MFLLFSVWCGTFLHSICWSFSVYGKGVYGFSSSEMKDIADDAAFQSNQDFKLQVCFYLPFFLTKLHTQIFCIVVHKPVIADGSIIQPYYDQIPNSKLQHLKCLQNNGPHTHYNAKQDGKTSYRK